MPEPTQSKRMSTVLSALALIGAATTTIQQVVALRKQGQEQNTLTESIYEDTQTRLRELEARVLELQLRAESAQMRQEAAESKLLNRRQREDLEMMLAKAEETEKVVALKSVKRVEAKVVEEKKSLLPELSSLFAPAANAPPPQPEPEEDETEPVGLDAGVEEDTIRLPAVAGRLPRPSFSEMRLKAAEGKVWTATGWTKKE